MINIDMKDAILVSVNGSQLYGTNTDDSDNDVIGVFVEEPYNVFFGSPKETIQINGKANDRKREAGELDGQAYSVRHFCRLIAQGNPSVLNILFTHGEYILLNSKWGEQLLENKELFISKVAAPRFIGYMTSQKLRLEGEKKGHIPSRPEIVEKYGYDTKYAGHVIRLGLQGVEYLMTGELQVPMPAEAREMVLDVRGGKFTLNEVLEAADELLATLRKAGEESPLPDEPNLLAIAELVQNIYTDYWS